MAVETRRRHVRWLKYATVIVSSAYLCYLLVVPRLMQDYVDNDGNETRVLCWVMTMPKNLKSKANAVRKTWGRDCDRTLYFSSVSDDSLSVVGLNVSEGRSHLLSKTVKAFRYIYNNHFNEADWFIKADDDTYLIVDNLRHFLATKDHNSPVYYGERLKLVNVKNGFHSGGAGYVLSREALSRFATTPLDTNWCKADGGAEDTEVARCLDHLGVVATDAFDSLNRTTFHVYQPEIHISGSYHDWYRQWSVLETKHGVDSISEFPITFHYMTPDAMYAMDLALNHIRTHRRRRR